MRRGCCSLQRGSPRGGLLSRTIPVLCPFQPNLTSLTNQANRNERVRKFGSEGVPPGIPRIARTAVRPITLLHETPHVTVYGRNFCSGFSNNQYLLVSKRSKECVFVDAADDWPDDWVTFVSASGLKPTHVFLTHCHVDSIINLNALMSIMESHCGVRMGVMWCQAEQPWVDAFPKACLRYGRPEESRLTLPMLQNSLYSYHTHALRLQREQQRLDDEYARACAARKHERARRAGRGYSQEHEAGSDYGEDEEDCLLSSLSPKPPPPPQLVRQEDVLLSCATNRSTSFHEFGPNTLLHYIFTPGHSPGHMMLSLPRERLLFTGDTLYYGKVGRVDLPWATGERLAESLLALEGFSDATVLLPGHGRLSTLGRERRENVALRSLYERRALGQQQVSVGFNEGYL